MRVAEKGKTRFSFFSPLILLCKIYGLKKGGPAGGFFAPSICWLGAARVLPLLSRFQQVSLRQGKKSGSSL